MIMKFVAVLKTAMLGAMLLGGFVSIKAEARTTVVKQTVCRSGYHHARCVSSVRVVRTRHVHRHYRYYRYRHHCHRCY
jgi:hypothetical protein